MRSHHCRAMGYAAAILVERRVFAVYAIPNADDLRALRGLATGQTAAGAPVSLAVLWLGIVTCMFGHAGLARPALDLVMPAVAGHDCGWWPQREVWWPCGGECLAADSPLCVTKQDVNVDVDGPAASAYVRFREPGRVHGSGIDDEFHICR